MNVYLLITAVKYGEIMKREFDPLPGDAMKLVFTVKVVGVNTWVGRGHQVAPAAFPTVDVKVTSPGR